MRADAVEHLRKLLSVARGGVVFTTIQKFIRRKKAGRRRSSPSAEHRRDRGLTAPEPIRLDRRARAQSARLAPAGVVHRLDSSAAQLGRALPSALRSLCRSVPPLSIHRDADCEDGRQYARGLRRLHQHLRHPASPPLTSSLIPHPPARPWSRSRGMPIYYESRLAKIDEEFEAEARSESRVWAVTDAEQRPGFQMLEEGDRETRSSAREAACAPLSQPRHRHAGSDRRANQARQRNERRDSVRRAFLSCSSRTEWPLHQLAGKFLKSSNPSLTALSRTGSGIGRQFRDVSLPPRQGQRRSRR